MGRRKYVRFTSEADIEAACSSMDRRELDWLHELDDDVADREDDERAMVLEACSGRLDEDW